ncbi:MAG: bifunctional FO biosynthesis protein CofGH [Gammaproteobacteria bacterium]|nr:bifunctional FO biosynthesis protein CofGH [Gammaproteobacteria bacterium]
MLNIDEVVSWSRSDVRELMARAAELRDEGHCRVVSYSPKVFIPLTKLCRDVCHYCTFAQPPRPGQRAYMSIEEVLDIARAGADAGCHEALFTLGDKPEARYKAARDELAALGHASTLSYLREAAQAVLDETGLLPHMNPGVMTQSELEDLRPVSVSQGLMLESSSTRLCEKGSPHYGSPDKRPQVRLDSIAAAGAAQAPFTSGILIGIGETRRERLEALLALRDLNEAHGHIQEIIVQNFRRKPGTKMHDAPEPALEELLWTIAMARLIFGPHMNIQAPPNLTLDESLPDLIHAGINDWGGVSPVTPDHVNPEAAWPHLDRLRTATETAGKTLAPRLPVYPAYIHERDTWIDPALHTRVLRKIDAAGFARPDDWAPGSSGQKTEYTRQGTDPRLQHAGACLNPSPHPRGEGTGNGRQTASEKPQWAMHNGLGTVINKAVAGTRLTEAEIITLFNARGADEDAVLQAADNLRRTMNGDTVSYVVNRNINYTNICYFGCGFCAFSKGRVAENLRERGYDLPLEEIQARVSEAWERGATEVCLQGGIHPDYTGATYLAIVRAVKEAQPDMHVHAFSPLEIRQGAETLGLPLEDYLGQLKQAGLGTLPGTAAEILDDEIRQIICPDKLNTAEWLEVMRTAHSLGLNSTSTIMFGHVDGPLNWARHLLRIRDLQEETGGFTEFVPLPFVHMEAPMYRKGRARKGPTFREAVLMHAVARLVLHPHITNIQASWVKLGMDGLRACLDAGVNDVGGTLMNESISRAAGASHGQEFTAAGMRELITSAGRIPQQRTTRYEPVTEAGKFGDTTLVSELRNCRGQSKISDEILTLTPRVPSIPRHQGSE